MKFSLDQVAFSIVISALSLLLLPDFLLLQWQWASGVALLLVGLARTKIGGEIKTYLKFTALLLLGAAYMHHSATQLLTQAEQVAQLPAKIQTQFRVVAIQAQQDYQALVIRTKLAPEQSEQLIYAQWKLEEKPQIGEIWLGELRLRPLSSRLNFNGFDRQQWYFSKGIIAWASVKSAVKIGEDFSLREKLLQQALRQTESLSQQGLLLALSFGERAWLPAPVWQIYQQTNTAHLIAISGLHIGLAMMFGMLLARGLQLALPTRWMTPFMPLLCGLLFALGYAYLAGFAVPTLRAAVALLLLCMIRWQRLCWDRWRLLLRIVALLLLIDPLMILSTSFWLSVGAVACLLLWYQVFPMSLLHWRGLPLNKNPLNKQPWKMIRYLLSLLHLQFGLLCLFTPIQLLFFNGLSLAGFFANLIAVPLYSLLLVPLVLFATLTQGAWHSWQAANFLAEKITALIAFWQGHWQPVSIDWSLLLTALLTLLFLLAMHCLYAPRATEHNDLIQQLKQQPRWFHLQVSKPLSRSSRSAVNLAGILLCLYCVGNFAYRQFQPNWQLDALDVGQGLAHLIVKNGRGVLYDSGAAWQNGSMAELEILPYLRREGIQLEQLILSHDDNDHAGGAKAILQAYPDALLISPSRKNYQENHRTFCQKDLQWEWQGLHFHALAPNHVVERANNPDSCVVLVTDGHFRLLLTGDAEASSEQQFAPKLAKIDVLQVGHHGSKTSTSQQLLDHAQPQIALISSGRWNPWHFPHAPVLERLIQQKIQIFNTALDGQIRLSFYQKQNEAQLEIDTARHLFSPWYRRLIGLKVK